MALWKLTPIDPGDRNWAASTFNEEVVVRADDEARARRLAARAFGIATRHRPGEEVRVVPWDNRQLVRAANVEAATDYDENGPEGIVFPQSAADLGRDH